MMSKITTLFWDLGGVILTNGWDLSSRKKAAQKFNLDFGTFEDRHAALEEGFETGRIGLDTYLEEVLSLQKTAIPKNEFKSFMFSFSQAQTQTIEIVERLADTQKYHMAVINNESLELNLFRIQKFNLRDYFSAFFSSCFLGLRKPDRRIYEQVLHIVQRKPEECLFIDDRKENLDEADALGISTIQYKDAHLLEHDIHLRLAA